MIWVLHSDIIPGDLASNTWRNNAYKISYIREKRKANITEWWLNGTEWCKGAPFFLLFIIIISISFVVVISPQEHVFPLKDFTKFWMSPSYRNGHGSDYSLYLLVLLIVFEYKNRSTVISEYKYRMLVLVWKMVFHFLSILFEKWR